jgi:glyoxylase-like metal-dependent hydrolase (beta-lactamase superfamily II)
VIDPGDEIGELLDLIGRHHLTIRGILLTHAHVDHVTGVPAAKRALGVPVFLHQDDLFLYEHAIEHGAMFGLSVEPLPPVDRFYAVGQRLSFGDYDVHVHHTPGHCPGGVCLQVRKPGESGQDLFVGDTLFAGSIGRTDLPGGNHETLIHSIRTVLFAFGDDARVHPGHGPSTTIGHERRTNPFVADR